SLHRHAAKRRKRAPPACGHHPARRRRADTDAHREIHARSAQPHPDGAVVAIADGRAVAPGQGRHGARHRRRREPAVLAPARWPVRQRRPVHRLRGAVSMAYEAFLSQDEVDALLAGVTGESDSESRDEADARGARAYDLSSPDRVVRRRMQTLELINERFARHLRHLLLNFMRRNADITVGSIKILKYADFERNLPVPSNLNMIQM